MGEIFYNLGIKKDFQNITIKMKGHGMKYMRNMIISI